MRLKNSVGIWAFGTTPTRFLPSGYHAEVAEETMEERTKRVVEGVGDLVDGFEYHYPGELNEENRPAVQKALGTKDIYALALGTFSDPRFGKGSFVNPDPKLRKEAIEITKKGLNLAADIGCKFIIWPGGEGYNYPFQVNYGQTWKWFITGLAEAIDYANSVGVPVLLEHKNSEPAMKILMCNLGMAMYTIRKIAEQGVDVTNVKLNMDWQHCIMNGETLAEYASILASENLLGHMHANSGWGTFDDDNMVGASFFMQTLALAEELQRLGYGKEGERMGYDLFPYTEDPIEAVKRSVLQWEFFWYTARKIDDSSLDEALAKKDAVAAYGIVYEALGLDDDFVDLVKLKYSR